MKTLGIAVLLGAAVCAGPLAADREVPTAMAPYITEEEWRAAGLDQLNPAELAQFQAWFVRTMRGAPPPALDPPREGAAPAAMQDVPAPAGRTESERRFGNEQLENVDDITARVVGTFDGWDGPTTFELDNGQVWRTIGSARFTPIQPIENAVVTISRGAFNSYRLKVEGYNTTAPVKRIE